MTRSETASCCATAPGSFVAEIAFDEEGFVTLRRARGRSARWWSLSCRGTRNLHGYFSSGLEPVSRSNRATRCGSPRRTTVGTSPGEQIERREARTGHRPRHRRPDRRSRAAGETLVVGIEEVIPGTLGRDVLRQAPCGVDARRRRRPRAGLVDLAPFLGVMGMPPPDPGSPLDGAAAAMGRNIDCKGSSPARRSICDPGRRRSLLGWRRTRRPGRR